MSLNANARLVDPTRTKALRDRFATLLTRRFNKLKLEVKASIVTNDAFGLTRGIRCNDRS